MEMKYFEAKFRIGSKQYLYKSELNLLFLIVCLRVRVNDSN